jgi:phenylacetate-CoA ligase
MNQVERENLRGLDRQGLQDLQLIKLNRLLDKVLPHNAFYRERLACDSLHIESLDQWAEIPTLTKGELIAGDGSDVAAHHTYAAKEYTRLHRTSGTRGRPMIIMDTPTDWQWWLDTWQFIWDAAGANASDTVFMAFSFGPFIGFWSAFEAATQRGLKAVPGGGLSTAARLDLMRASKANILCCTPTYALHLAEEAREQGIDLAKLGIRKIVVAGEPGGSIPSVRQRIESAWNATLVDHAGATEVGPWGCGTADGNDLFVIESEFIAEYLPVGKSIASAGNGAAGEAYELVLTSLGRDGVPIFRYRTGDIVCPDFTSWEGCNFVRLRGGILGRADDMLIVRGVNVFPSSIESILRSVDSISEYRLTIDKDGFMDQLTIEVEDAAHEPRKIVDLFSVRLGLRVQVVDCPAGSLPRFEGKAKRLVDRR